jgi:hypothetical protein
MSVRDDIEKVGDSKSIPSELVRYTFFLSLTWVSGLAYAHLD